MLANSNTKKLSGSKLCRRDRGIWAKCANIWLLWRHAGNMLATFSAKLDPMESLEKIKEVVEVFNSNIFYAKVINNEAELDGKPFVAPETRGGFHLVVAFSKKARSEEIVGQDASLGKAITALVNFKVNPTVAVSTCKLLFFYEFRWDVGDLDATYSGSGIGASR